MGNKPHCTLCKRHEGNIRVDILDSLQQTDKIDNNNHLWLLLTVTSQWIHYHEAALMCSLTKNSSWVQLRIRENQKKGKIRGKPS